MEWLADRGVTFLLFLVIAAMVVAVPLAIIASHNPTIELRKDHWTCAKYFEYTFGKDLIVECTSWVKKGFK